MADGSLTLLLGAQIGQSAAPVYAGADASLRIVPVAGFFVQPRLGAAIQGAPVGAAWGWVLHVGAGLGWITAVGHEIGFTLGAGYDLLLVGAYDVWLPVHRFLAQASLPIVLGDAVIEPYLDLGAQLVEGGVDAAGGLGLRAGVTW